MVTCLRARVPCVFRGGKEQPAATSEEVLQACDSRHFLTLLSDVYAAHSNPESTHTRGGITDSSPRRSSHLFFVRAPGERGIAKSQNCAITGG